MKGNFNCGNNSFIIIFCDHIILFSLRHPIHFFLKFPLFHSYLCLFRTGCPSKVASTFASYLEGARFESQTENLLL